MQDEHDKTAKDNSPLEELSAALDHLQKAAIKATQELEKHPSLNHVKQEAEKALHTAQELAGPVAKEFASKAIVELGKLWNKK